MGFDQGFGDRDLAQCQRVSAFAVSYQVSLVTARDDSQTAIFEIGFGDREPDGQDVAFVGVVGYDALVLVPVDAGGQARAGFAG